MEKVQAIIPEFSNFMQIIADIAAIAENLAYKKNITEECQPTGFLVSAYGMEEYKKFAQAEQLHAILKNGQPVAWSVVYSPIHPASEDDEGTFYIRKQFGNVPIVKQIGTARGHEGQGYSRSLYQRVIDKYPDLPIFAAIVEEPKNERSEGFHSKLGFRKCAVFSHPDGKRRGIWKRPPTGGLHRQYIRT